MIRRFRARVALATLLLLLVGLARAARADYDARRSAVMDIVNKAGLAEEEKKAITTAFSTYFNQRSRCLGDLIEILEDDDKDPQAPRWHTRAQSCETDGARTLGQALKNVREPSKKALDLMNQLKMEEDKFYGALTIVTVAERRDVIVELGVRLEQKSDLLFKEWNSIQYSDNSIDQQLQNAVQRVDRQISDVMRAAADKHKDVSLRIAEMVKAWGDSPGSTGTVIDNAQLPLAWLAQKWIEFKGRELEFATMMADTARRETSVIVMFNEVRDDTKEFLEKGSFDNARAALQQAQYSAHGFVGNVSAPGQKDDAADFRTRALDALTDHMEDAEKIWVKFVSQNEHKFFGAISPDIKEALIETRDGDRWRRQLEDHRLQTQLASWRSDAEHYFGVSFSGLTSEQRSKLKAALQPHIDKYVESMNEADEADKKMLEQANERKELEDKFDD